jgi:hypothetical protein
MMSFLRKYNKVLFAFFSVVLMVTWLVPSAIQQLSKNSAAANAVWATVGDGEKVTIVEEQKLTRQVKIIDSLKLPMAKDLGITNNPAQWYLLVREARQAGLVGGPSEGREVLQKLAGGDAHPGEEMSREALLLLGQLCSASGWQPPMVYQTLAELAASAPRISEARLKSAAQNALTGVSADVVVISADKPLPANDPQPTPEQVDALVKANADKAPGAGPHGVGYRQPEQVALEWFVVPAEQVRNQLMNDPRLASVELRKAFLRNPTAFGAKIGETDPQFDAFKDQVRTAVLDQITAARMEEMVKFIVDQTQLSTRAFPKDGIYAKLPADLNGLPTLATLAADLSQQFAVPAPKVESAGPTEISKLASIPGLGTASSDRFGAQPMPLPQLIAMTRELNPPEARAVLQVGVIGPPLRAPDPSQPPQRDPKLTPSSKPLTTDLYAFRVVKAAPAHAATGTAEVATQAFQDEQKLLRFEALDKNRAAIESEARSKGLEALAQEYGAKVEFAPQIRGADVKFLQYGLKMPTTIPGLGEDPKVVDQIVKQALAIPEADFAAAPDAARTFVVASPDKLALVAVHLRDVLPMFAEDYTSLASNQRFRAALLNDRTQVKPAEEFSFESLSARNKFKPTREPTGPVDNSPPPPPDFGG